MHFICFIQLCARAWIVQREKKTRKNKNKKVHCIRYWVEESPLLSLLYVSHIQKITRIFLNSLQQQQKQQKSYKNIYVKEEEITPKKTPVHYWSL